ncbi:MAG TPA: Bax inhibitor-1 family protein [Polyangiaceae bacterium]
MNFVVNTGNAQRDQEELGRYQQQYRAQGLDVYAQPLPTGGFQVTVFQPQPGAAGQQQYGAPPQQYGAPPPQQYGAPPPQQYGAPPPNNAAAVYAMAGGGGAMSAGATATDGAPPLTVQRVAYLRKVYGLLSVAAFLALGAGWASVTLGPTMDMTTSDGHVLRVPLLVSIMLQNPIVMYGAFGLLFVGTFAASAVSKVRVLNVVALMAIALLMGVELSPMVFVAQFSAGLGDSLSANPVRDTMVMVLAVFSGITGYVFVTRKDFSWMRSILSMGVVVVFAACILTFVFQTEVFSLAVASVGALLSIGLLLYVTSYIFRNSEMDDAVGDALSLLVQLRNLFMFLLRILMSSRR